MLCQKCKKNTATVHLTDLIKGEKREKHLCEECASEEGVTVKQHVSITDVLNSFLMSQSAIQELANLKCPECGLTFVEFRTQGLLGCPNDYDVFGEPLAAVISKAQNSKLEAFVAELERGQGTTAHVRREDGRVTAAAVPILVHRASDWSSPIRSSRRSSTCSESFARRSIPRTTVGRRACATSWRIWIHHEHRRSHPIDRRMARHRRPDG